MTAVVVSRRRRTRDDHSAGSSRLASYLNDTVELLDGSGRVLDRLGPDVGVLGQRPGGPASGATIDPDDLPRLLAFRAAALSSLPGWRGELAYRIRTAEGVSAFAVDVINQTDDPELPGLVATTRSLATGPREPNTVVDLTDATFGGSLAEAVPMALMVLDAHGRMEFANQAARALCDLPCGPTEGRFLPDLAIESDRSTVTIAVRELMRHLGSRIVVFATRGWQGRGDLRLVEARLLARGQAGNLSAIVVTLDDVTERRREEDDLRRRASSDPLTGLLNRAALLEEAEARLASGPVTAVYCDLVGFKAINDTFGHAWGDDLLVEVATLLTSLARSTDAIGRLGGDEFVILCDGLSQAHTATLVARLDAAFDAGLGVRISVGVASSRTGGSATDLLALADRAMYAHKRRTALSG